MASKPSRWSIATTAPRRAVARRSPRRSPTARPTPNFQAVRRAEPSSIAVRNKAIKAALTKEFGKGKVTVTGSRGTAYGWIRVHIAVAPRHNEHRRELVAKVWRVLDTAGLSKQIGTFDSADYGSGRNIHIDFERVKNPDPLARD